LKIFNNNNFPAYDATIFAVIVLKNVTYNRQNIPYNLTQPLIELLSRTKEQTEYTNDLSKILWYITQSSSALPSNLIEVVQQKLNQGIVNESLISIIDLAYRRMEIFEDKDEFEKIKNNFIISNVNDNKHLKESAKGFGNQIKEKGPDELLVELYNTQDSDNLEYSLASHHLAARIIKIQKLYSSNQLDEEGIKNWATNFRKNS
jgi:hypothetical protein